LVAAVLAALLHVFIFYLEALAWTSPRARAVFGTSADEAQATKEMAYNQGFYNLFLAVVTIIGVLFRLIGDHAAIGDALIFAGAGSMLAAALVLGLSSPAHRGAALKQGLLPGIAVVALLVAVLA